MLDAGIVDRRRRRRTSIAGRFNGPVFSLFYILCVLELLIITLNDANFIGFGAILET
jgi:hypothetical protein